MQPAVESAEMTQAAAYARGLVLVILTVVMWGAFLPISKAAIAAVDLYWLNTLRFGVVLPAFVALLWIREGKAAFRFDGRFTDVLLFSVLGYALYTNLVYEGARRVRPEHGAALLALTPLWFAAYQWRTSGRAPSRGVMACIALVIVGEVLVVSHGDLTTLFDGADGQLFGAALIIISSISWVGYSVGARRMAAWSALRYSTLTCLVGWVAGLGVTLAATALGHSRPPAWQDLQTVMPQFAFLAIFISFFSFLTWNSAVRLLGPLNAGLFTPFAPVIAFVIAAAQGRQFAGLEIVGAVLVLLALVANNLLARRAMLRGGNQTLTAKTASKP